MKKLNLVDWVALLLVIIGGLNWGLVGVFNFNLVEKILGSIPSLLKIIYALVGLAGIYILIILPKLGKK